jgi:N-acetylglucosamine-6-phosphate deacetylase
VRLGVAAAVVDGALVPGDLEVLDGRVAGVGLAGGGRGIAIPGLVDLQVNGFAGIDFATADADAYGLAGAALLATGVTAFQPTLITAPEAALAAALAAVPKDAGPRVIGVHLEGPFLSPERLGAHDHAARRDPDAALLARLLTAGPVTQVTLAPELEGAFVLIDLLRRRGIVVACGHSDATAAEAHHAFDLGATTVTHLFNAMRPLGHRDPGLVGAALAREDVSIQLIVDGNHLADETIRIVWAAAAGRIALVSDATAATRGDGNGYELGAVGIEVRDGVPQRHDGTLAGGSATLLEAVRRLHALGVPLAHAVGAAATVPARIAGRLDLGSLRPGAGADVVVLDDDLELHRTLVAGEDRL